MRTGACELPPTRRAGSSPLAMRRRTVSVETRSARAASSMVSSASSRVVLAADLFTSASQQASASERRSALRTLPRTPDTCGTDLGGGPIDDHLPFRPRPALSAPAATSSPVRIVRAERFAATQAGSPGERAPTRDVPSAGAVLDYRPSEELSEGALGQLATSDASARFIKLDGLPVARQPRYAPTRPSLGAEVTAERCGALSTGAEDALFGHSGG